MEGGVGQRLGDYTAQTEGSCFIASYIKSTEDSYSGENTHQVTARVTSAIKKK